MENRNLTVLSTMLGNYVKDNINIKNAFVNALQSMMTDANNATLYENVIRTLNMLGDFGNTTYITSNRQDERNLTESSQDNTTSLTETNRNYSYNSPTVFHRPNSPARTPIEEYIRTLPPVNENAYTSGVPNIYTDSDTEPDFTYA